MRKDLTPLIVIALVVAGIATGMFYVFMSGGAAPAAQANARGDVVVALRPLAAGETIQRTHLKTSKLALSQIPAGTAGDISQLEGRVVLGAIEPGIPIPLEKTSAPGGLGGVGIPEGMRAVSVHITDSSGVVAMLKPGHRIDLQSVHVKSEHSVEVRTIAEDIEILNVSRPQEGGGKPGLPVVTVLVDPATANAAGLADTSTRVRASLRNPLDRQQLNLPVMTLDRLLHPGAKPQPKPQQQ
ncbi:MAG: Flp pilus assembly protein CpaB [Acidobacteria bacterium]|nr:Flp pilus assembly protein CpaB [Acidobacteriota bacterium]